MSDGPTRSLLLVHDARYMDPADFEEVARRIRLRAPDIWARAVDNHAQHRSIVRRMAALPTLTVCPFPLERFRPLRGRIYQGRPLGKVVQLELFDAAAVPVPKWTVVEETTALDPAEWGPAVVVKPEWGIRSRGIRLVRTERLAAHLATLSERYRLRPGERVIAQAYIDTGPRPSYYRVLSLLGQALFAKIDVRREPDTPEDFAEIPDEGIEIAVPRDPERDRAFDASPDVLALARRAHEALDAVAVIGADIVREHATGRLYVLETNPSGHVWHLSSAMGRQVQEAFAMDYYAQMDALERAADVLIERTRAEAE